MDYYSARLLCPWDFPGKNTGVGCHFLLQGFLPNPGLPQHCRQTLYHLNIGVDCHSFLQRNFPTQGLNPGLLHCKQIIYCLSYREVLLLLCNRKKLTTETWMNPKSIMLSERSQTLKNCTPYDTIYITNKLYQWLPGTGSRGLLSNILLLEYVMTCLSSHSTSHYNRYIMVYCV